MLVFVIAFGTFMWLKPDITLKMAKLTLPVTKNIKIPSYLLREAQYAVICKAIAFFAGVLYLIFSFDFILKHTSGKHSQDKLEGEHK